MILKNYIVLNKKGIRYLFGEIYEDSRFEDGHLILTSKLVDINEDFAMTASMSKYQLGNELDLKAFCDHLMVTRLKSQGRPYCLHILNIILCNHDCPKWFPQYIADVQLYKEPDLDALMNN